MSIFLMIIMQFKYICRCSYILRNCCEASQIYYFAEDTYGGLSQYVRSIANNHKALALAIATVVVLLLIPVPIGSTLASTKSFPNNSHNIKTATETSKSHHGSPNLHSPPKSHTSSEHSSHCRHHSSSVLVNIFRHRLQTLQIMFACLTL